MSAITEVIILLVVAAAMFVVGFRFKLAVGIIMTLASLAMAFVAGFGIPINHLIEGTFYFEHLMFIIISGILFIGIMTGTGALSAITKWIISKTYKQPSLLLAIIAIIVMFPAMVTGSTPVAVVSTGVLVAPILLRMGIPKLEAAAIIGMCALFGQSAPPVNAMIMTICTSTFMPYEGFGLPLAIMCFPLAIISAIVLGRKYTSVEVLKEIVDEDMKNKEILTDAAIFKLFIPLIVMSVLFILPRINPFVFPDPGPGLVFVFSSVFAYFLGVKRIRFFEQSLTTFREAFVVMVLFIGMGVFVHFMSFTGISGFLATMTISLPEWALYLSSALMPVLISGPVVPFGTAAIVGPPLVLSFSAKNSIMVASGVSMFLSLGCLIPPTALSSLFAARILGMEGQYLKVTVRCWKLALLTAVVGFIAIYYANPIANILGL